MRTPVYRTILGKMHTYTYSDRTATKHTPPIPASWMHGFELGFELGGSAAGALPCMLLYTMLWQQLAYNPARSYMASASSIATPRLVQNSPSLRPDFKSQAIMKDGRSRVPVRTGYK